MDDAPSQSPYSLSIGIPGDRIHITRSRVWLTSPRWTTPEKDSPNCWTVGCDAEAAQRFSGIRRLDLKTQKDRA
jgi:hypothetical protein